MPREWDTTGAAHPRRPEVEERGAPPRPGLASRDRRPARAEIRGASQRQTPAPASQLVIVGATYQLVHPDRQCRSSEEYTRQVLDAVASKLKLPGEDAKV